MPNPRSNIYEFASSFGVSRHTVRAYIKQGLLEPPGGKWPDVEYGEGHRVQFELVRLLAAGGMLLKDIAAYFQNHPLSLADMERLRDALRLREKTHEPTGKWREGYVDPVLFAYERGQPLGVTAVDVEGAGHEAPQFADIRGELATIEHRLTDIENTLERLSSVLLSAPQEQ